MADTNGCFPGQSRGYKPPNRPDQSWAIMQAPTHLPFILSPACASFASMLLWRWQEEAKMMETIKAEPKYSVTGKPGNWKRTWQDSLGAPP